MLCSFSYPSQGSVPPLVPCRRATAMNHNESARPSLHRQHQHRSPTMRGLTPGLLVLGVLVETEPCTCSSSVFDHGSLTCGPVHPQAAASAQMLGEGEGWASTAAAAALLLLASEDDLADKVEFMFWLLDRCRLSILVFSNLPQGHSFISKQSINRCLSIVHWPCCNHGCVGHRKSLGLSASIR